jgi:hypothetical protein
MRSRVLVAAALPVIVILAGCSTAPPDPYADYRQTTVEVVPGTFDWQLHPVDEGFRPTISPEAAYAAVFEAGDRPDATAVLAQVGNAVEDTVGPPAWVFITPHMCFATAKGDLVSPGRSGDGCTDENLYVQGVDATTGETLGGFSAYDPPTHWQPARAGQPAPVVATTQAGSTRLH